MGSKDKLLLQIAELTDKFNKLQKEFDDFKNEDWVPQTRNDYSDLAKKTYINFKKFMLKCKEYQTNQEYGKTGAYLVILFKKDGKVGKVRSIPSVNNYFGGESKYYYSWEFNGISSTYKAEELFKFVGEVKELAC